jgi:hypothetical protein
MPFLGKTPKQVELSSFGTRVKDDFTANGSTTAFTLSKSVSNPNDIAVFVGNVRQEPTDAYTVNGTTLTMSDAPATGLNFYVVHTAGTIESSVVPSDGTITSAKLSSAVNTSIAAKLPLSGGTMTGNLVVSAASPNVDVSDTGTSHASQDFLTNSNAARTTIGVERAAGGGLFVGSSAHAAVFGSAGANSTQIASNNTVRMTVDTAGKVGIGDTSPSARLEIGGMAAGEQALLIQSPRNDALSNGLARINITDSNCPFEGLLIDHAGTGTALVANSGGSGVPLLLHRTANSGQIALFYRSGANVGNISVATSSTSYNTSSDYRLKENVVDLTGASARVNQLDVKRFNFIADDTNTLVDGFLAHEVATVVPEAINGTHNEVEVWKADEELPDGVSAGDNKLDDDGNTIPVYQGIDQSKLVPLLTAALQEALSEIASLKTRVQSLEDE